MNRSLVLCFDGTSNEFGSHNSNVIRLVQVIDRDSQQLYYDAGIGTLPDPRFVTGFGKRISEWVDLGFGTGLTGKVESAYRYLMDHWEPETKVFIFGFSRGAYTARVLAGMLHSLGLLSPGNHNLVRHAMNLFRSIRGGSEEPIDSTYWRLCNGFRSTFARRIDGEDRHFKVHFLGLWDTVSSVGWLWEPQTFRFTAKNPSVKVARHAISIDERRAFFRQNRLSATELRTGQDWQELWFPGVHADVGGGYAENEGSLWLVAFDWMIEQAIQHGLMTDASRLQRVRNHMGTAPTRPWAEPAHMSLTSAWRLAEYFPKRRWNREPEGYEYRMNKGRPRELQKGDMIHESALRRVQECNYRPLNFSNAFIEKIKALAPVPPSLPFEP